MKALTAKFHIALGEAFIVVSLLLSAIYLGLIPDRIGAIREHRAALAETIAITSSAFITQNDIESLKANLELIVARNDDIQSAAIKLNNGRWIISIDDHNLHWEALSDEYSPDSQLLVPIWTGKEKWGNIELKFKPLSDKGWRGVIHSTKFQLMIFIAFGSFIAFYFYLSKMLRHLDPSRAVPGRVRSALDTLTEGLLVVDPNEYIVLANEAFASIVGTTPDELVGQNATALNWETKNKASQQAEDFPWLEAIKEGVNIKNRMIYLIDGNEKKRKFIVNCSLVLGSGNKNGGVLISFQDVTELEKKEIELKKSINQAEAANHAKSEFLANMSHEIRTPMNAILGFTEVLRRGYGDGEKDSKKHLETIYSSGKHLLELINDILDLSKVESGHLEIEKIDCAPQEVIADVVNVLAVRASEKGVFLDFKIEGAIPETILSDPSRLRQIVTNLVGNAIKFTDEGSVTVILKALLAEDEPKILINIIDTGIGIPEAKLSTIFDPFVQADSSVTRRFGGTGLGLAISRKFAESLGGNVSVTSESGKGSVFSVTIDPGSLEGVRLLEPEEALITVQETKTDSRINWDFPDARILVVDDGVENRELVKLVLMELGLNVYTAVNGKEAVEKSFQAPFDIILMDVQMPVMDGFTAVKKMRERGLTCPVVALTAHAMKGFDKECLAAGYSGYLPKPIDIDQLIDMLAGELGATQCEHDTITAVELKTDVPTGNAVGSNPKMESDNDAVREILLDKFELNSNSYNKDPIVSKWSNNPKFHPIIASFIQRLEEQLGAMEKAWQAKDYKELEGLAHWLKGAGGTVGFNAFTEPAFELEQYAKVGEDNASGEVILVLRQLSERLVITGDNGVVNHENGSDKDTVEEILLDKPELSGNSDNVDPIVSRWASNPKFHPIITNFTQRLEEQLGAMEKAWQEKDYKELESLAHWLKGAGGTVGFDVFTEPALALEQYAKAGTDNACGEAIIVLCRLSERLVIPGGTDELKYSENALL